MTCPKCGSSKIRSRGTGTTDCTGRVAISGMEYECEDCWWNWSKGEADKEDYGLTWVPSGTIKKIATGEISEEDIKKIRDAQDKEDRRRKAWEHANRFLVFDKLYNPW